MGSHALGACGKRRSLRLGALPIALMPDAQGACFSGSAIVDEHDVTGLFDGQPGLLAFYTCHRVLSDDPEDYEQSQCVAYSRDT